MRATPALLLLPCLLTQACRGPRAAPEPITVEPPPSWEEPQPSDEPRDGRPSDALVGPVALDPDYWSIWDPDSIHRRLTGQAQDTGAWIDEFLSNERSTSEENQSWFQVESRNFMEEANGLDARLKVRAHLTLPGTEERLQLVLSGEDDDNLSSLGDPDRLADADPAVAAQEDDGASVGLKYFLKATQRNNVSLTGGLKFNGISPNPYVSARWRHEQPLAPFLFRVTERYRYFLEERGESRTVMDLERSLNEVFFLRLSGSGDWWEEREGFYYGLFATLYEQHSPQRVLSYELGSTFATEPNNVLTSTFARIRARQLFTRDWILLELAPQVSWPRDLDYEPVLGVLLTLKVTFRQRDLITNPLYQ